MGQVAWLGEAGSEDVATTGGKAANLARLAARYEVPPGFCLTVAAHAQWSSRVLAGERPAEFVSLVSDAYTALSERCGAELPPVAVRSSAVDEDGADASFAGVFVSCLNIRGIEALLEAIARCWASAEDPRALEYRARQGLGTAGVGVLVQEMVAADAAAVVFSRNPAGSDEVLINANYGIGESIVSGLASPDTWFLQRADLSVARFVVGQKATMTIYDGANGTREIAVLRTLRSRACLTPEQVDALGRLALALEDEMGWPVDLECAFRGGALWLLQCRPITARP